MKKSNVSPEKIEGVYTRAMKVLLQLRGINKRYGARVLFDGMSATFAEGQKIGVIGRNGAGKSTLCKIITGHEEADSGEILPGGDLRLSYLEQHDPYTLEETAMAFLCRYARKEPWQCAQMGWRFQLGNDILEQTIGSLPGGYRTRVKLTAMMLAEPNFLILDEPTNYLDLKTLILVENFLQDYRGGFLLVSHDRELLKRTCEQTLEVENGTATVYPGSVEEYLVFKEERREQAENYNKNVRAKQEQLQEFIDRFRAKASKASQARAKMKQLERLKTIETGHALGNVHIRIPPVDRKNGIALRCENLSVGYPEKLVAHDIRLEIPQGSRVAILGDNGQGKTTFLRTIAGDLPQLDGAFRWGHGIHIGYYAQHVFSGLDSASEVYDYLAGKAGRAVTPQEILNMAGSFLFKGDDVRKKISVLSGGERARLVLAGLLLTRKNTLLLDEPTNHLDFETVEALGAALKDFAGTLFFISHDRTFVNLVANEMLIVNDGAVTRYPGNYEDYVWHLENSVRDELRDAPSARAGVQGAKGRAPEKTSYHARKELESKRTKLKTQIRKTEERMAQYKSELEVIHNDFVADQDAWSRERNHRYEELARLIEKEEEHWLELHQQAEELGGFGSGS
jgi:ATP-binding cassette subfamily F protein 3